MKHILILFLGLVVCFSFPQGAFAQSVLNVKGSKTMIDMGGQAWNPGDKLFAMDGMGKKRALMQITQVKNGKAIAEVTKGQVQPGMTLIVAAKGNGAAPAPRQRGSSEPTIGSMIKGLKSGSAYGFSAALMMNSMKIASLNGAITSNFTMTGINFGAGGFYDYPLTREWFVRANGTFEMFSVAKKFAYNNCKNGTSGNCNANFMQLGGYGTFNYIFTPSPYRFWAGAGGGALFYLSKSSTVLNTQKTFFNTLLMGAAGLDIFTSKNTFIPITFEYQTIPDKQAAVTALVLRGGWGKTF